MSMVGIWVGYRFKKGLLKLKSLFILSGKTRKRYKKYYFNKYASNLVKKTKWGVSYSVFDGHELLEASIKSIRKQANYVNVVYQTISWYGNPASEDLVSHLLNLKEKGLIDQLIEFTPNLKLPAHKNELAKRNIGLKKAKKAGCNYLMTMDTDEFYINDELASTKKYIVQENITHAFCPQVLYGLKPNLRVVNPIPKACMVQIFSKLKRGSFLGKNFYVPCIIDYTRCFSHFFGAKYLVFNTINMHHMMLVRKDLDKKFTNSTYPSSKDKNNLTKGVEFIDVGDIFGVEDNKG